MLNPVSRTLLLLTSAAVVTDLLYGRIPNLLAAAGFIAGFILRFLHPSLGAAPSSALGALIPLAGGFLLWRSGMIGAGDVKLLGAAGSLAGFPDILGIVTASVFCGACISAALMLTCTGVKERLFYFASYVKRTALGGSTSGYRSGGAERPEHFHFAVPVFMASALYAAGLSL